MTRLIPILAGAVTLALSPMAAMAQSAFGCIDTDAPSVYAAVEGRDGVFYRVNPDLHMFNAFSEGTADQVAALSTAMASLGTTLIYVPLPPKSLALPDHLPQAARDYGFDTSIATTVYIEAVKKLTERGVLVVDPRQALRAQGDAALSFFGTDYRMTAAGAEREARAIADVLNATPAYASLPKGRFDTSPAGTVAVPSPMRAALQRHCLFPLPEPTTQTFAATQLQAATQPSDNTIFGAGAVGARVAIVGTEIDGEAVANLSGFVSKYTGLQTVQYAVAGGGAYAAISSYLTSPAFQEQRPAFLIWSVPITENLARYGDQPLAELTAAAGDSCRVPLPTMANPQNGALVADLSSLDAGQNYTLFVDAGNAAASEARFDFTNAQGLVRSKAVYRNEDQVKTGRFYMPTSGLWPEGAQTVSIIMDAPFAAGSRVTACFK